MRPDPLVGTTLAGRFHILEQLARGGMGIIYRAEQVPLGRMCAVKVLRPSFDEQKNAEFHRRFFLEASTAARLTHPNTVTIFDYGHEGSLYFLAMELIVGRTLRQVLRDEGVLAPARALQIAIQICRSVQEAHQLGVVHRDLKPENIVLVDHNEELDSVKVLDFGLVKEVDKRKDDSVTGSAMCLGSPSYMAPEQVDGDFVTPAADVYALGVILYELLCGRPPFVRNSRYALVMAHLYEQPPPMTEALPSLEAPEELVRIIDRCLKKVPTERYADMGELLDVLRKLSRGTYGTTSAASRYTPSSKRRFALGTSAESSASGSGRIPSQGNAPANAPSSTHPNGISTTSAAVLHATEAHRESLRPSRRGMTIAAAAGAAIGTVAVLLLVLRLPAEPGAEATTLAPSATATAPAFRDPSSSGTAGAAPDAAKRTTRVVSVPAGASVQIGDREACAPTPCDILWTAEEASSEKEHELKVALDGYQTGTLKARATQAEVRADLAALPHPAAPVRNAPPPNGNQGRSSTSGFKDVPY